MPVTGRLILTKAALESKLHLLRHWQLILTRYNSQWRKFKLGSAKPQVGGFEAGHIGTSPVVNEADN